ncbi:type II toxin-antitoxin system HicA family toxin [Candidatus Woesearchaeota archaeon]|nr:type II toxin-antitoxin system HicA family toxin [Candidatus Woesearchaeota archaeon]
MKLPIISGINVVKILNKSGFSVTRQSGSHMILVKEGLEGKRTVVVPKHRELAKGTLLSIIS